MREIIKNDVFTSKDTTITLLPIPEQLLTVKDVASLLKCNIAASSRRDPLHEAWILQMPRVHLPAIFGRL